MVRGTKRKHTFRAQRRHEAASLLQQQQSTAAECTAEWCTTEERTQTKTSCSRFKQSSWLHRGARHRVQSLSATWRRESECVFAEHTFRRTHIPTCLRGASSAVWQSTRRVSLVQLQPWPLLARLAAPGLTPGTDLYYSQPAAPYSFSAFEVRQLAGAGWVVRRGGARSRNAGRAEAHRPVALSVASTGPAQGAAVSLLTRFVAAAGYDQSHSVSAPVGQPTAPARI